MYIRKTYTQKSLQDILKNFLVHSIQKDKAVVGIHEKLKLILKMSNKIKR